MDDQEFTRRMDALEKKIDAVYASAEKTRKMILWTVVATAVLFLLPFAGLVLVIPSFLSTYSNLANISM